MSRYNICRFFTAAFLVFWVLSVWADSNKDYLAAMDQIAKKKYSNGVKTYYKFLLKTDPVSSIPSRRKDLAPAFAFFKKACQQNPSDFNSKLFLSIIYRIIQNWQFAQSSLGEIQSRYPSSPLLQFLKGEYLLGNDLVDEAIAAFQKLKLLPRSATLAAFTDHLLKRRGIDKTTSIRRAALLKRANRHLDLMETDKAEAAFRLLIREFPQVAEGYRALIDLLVELNRLDDAEQVLVEFKSLTGMKERIPLQEARLRYFQKRFQDVVNILTPIETSDKSNDYILFFLAESAFQTGDFHRSATIFSKLFTRDPENIGFLLRKTASLEGEGNPASAAEILGIEVERRPDAPLVRMELAGLLERMSRLEEAKKEYQILLDQKSPFQAEAKERLESVIARLIEEEKQRLTRSFAEQKAGRGHIETSSATATIFSLPEKTESVEANSGNFDKMAHQQGDLAKRLARLSD
ncbi:MAG TPA: tetratricopeptide repeat protein [Candidatus Ozemobacteraceae bacterium]|nr:tetratricopeptide repeat protein [Candidatus Ozemobacteraceae bacterium]